MVMSELPDVLRPLIVEPVGQSRRTCPSFEADMRHQNECCKQNHGWHEGRMRKLTVGHEGASVAQSPPEGEMS